MACCCSGPTSPLCRPLNQPCFLSIVISQYVWLLIGVLVLCSTLIVQEVFWYKIPGYQARPGIFCESWGMEWGFFCLPCFPGCTKYRHKSLSLLYHYSHNMRINTDLSDLGHGHSHWLRHWSPFWLLIGCLDVKMIGDQRQETRPESLLMEDTASSWGHGIQLYPGEEEEKSQA